MYVVGSQEALRSISKSMVLPGKEKLVARLVQYFGEEFVMVNSISLAATHMIIFIRKELVPYLSEIKNDQLALGHGDVMANKGSVSIAFKLGNLRLLFITSHLCPHEDAKSLEKRNYQFLQTNQRFVLQMEGETTLDMGCIPRRSKKSNSRKTDSQGQLMEFWDAVLWLGDFNYRISSSNGMVQKLIESDDWKTLISNDQL